MMSSLTSVLMAGLLLGGIYSLVAIGLNLIFGVIRVVNFAQGEFVMLGMYATFVAYTVLHMDVYLSVVLVFPLLFAFGMLVQRFVLQRLQNEPTMQIFATFGLLMLLQNVVLALSGGRAISVNTPSSALAFAVGPVEVSVPRVIALAAVTLVAIALQWGLRQTMIGKSVRAVAQDRRAARLMGINVERTYMFTFGLGAGLAGLAGTLLTPIYTMSPQIGGNFILAAFAVVVLGGLGSVMGAYIGGFLIGITEALAGFYLDPSLKQAVWFAIFIVMLVARPTGLFGMAGAEEIGLRAQE
jgi:branched-chain amino acid transport system permease protein